MLPTCIGISGVSRYRNDASIEDSFLASLMRSSPKKITQRFGGASGAQTVLGFRTSGLCIFRRRICNGKRARPVELPELTLLLGQTIRHRPQRGRVDAQSDMTGEMHLDIFSGIGGTQQ